MTNDKKAKELGDKFARQYHHNNYPEFSSNSEFVFSNEEIEKACNEMANWKDQKFQEEKKQWIEKAFDLIENNIDTYLSINRDMMEAQIESENLSHIKLDKEMLLADV